MINRNPNLRKLAIAYAQNKVDLAEYRKLRTFQLSALDFGKPSPELPPEVAQIEIPSINIDPPNKPFENGGSGKIIKLVLVLFIFIAAIGGGAYYYLNYMDKAPAKKSAVIKKKKAANPLTIEQRAERMVNKRVWTSRDLEQFQQAWTKMGGRKKADARASAWFSGLEDTVKERIEETKSLIDADGASEQDEAMLNNLRLFYAYIKTE